MQKSNCSEECTVYLINQQLSQRIKRWYFQHLITVTSFITAFLLKMRRLQKLQNCAFRSIQNVDRYAHTLDMHYSLNMDMLDVRREKHTANQVYEYLNNQGQPTCRDMFTYIHDYHQVNTCSSNSQSLVLSRVNLSMTNRNIRYFEVRIWGKRQQEIQMSPSLESFKKLSININIKWCEKSKHPKYPVIRSPHSSMDISWGYTIEHRVHDKCWTLSTPANIPTFHNHLFIHISCISVSESPRKLLLCISDPK